MIAAALNASCMSWMEFRDHTRKAARYSHVATSLRNLMTWWNNLTSVEQASVENIQKLVNGGEDVMMTEMSSWISTSHEETQK